MRTPKRAIGTATAFVAVWSVFHQGSRLTPCASQPLFVPKSLSSRKFNNQGKNKIRPFDDRHTFQKRAAHLHFCRPKPPTRHLSTSTTHAFAHRSTSVRQIFFFFFFPSSFKHNGILRCRFTNACSAGNSACLGRIRPGRTSPQRPRSVILVHGGRSPHAVRQDLGRSCR